MHIQHNTNNSVRFQGSGSVWPVCPVGLKKTMTWVILALCSLLGNVITL